MLNEKLTLVFTNSHKPLAPIINLVTWSSFSHVAILSTDMLTVVHSTLGGGGVKEIPVSELLDASKDFTFIEFSVNDAEAILAAARSQIGKPYDWTALVGIPFHRDWQEADSWFCSELVAWAFQEGGTPLFLSEEVHRIVPRHLYMLHPTRVL